METTRTCPQCRRPLAADAPQGLCPECLIKAGLGSGAHIGPETESRQPRFVAPSPAELAGRFPQLEILGFIGQGGMGAVYQARQKQLDRVVALKILPPGIGDDPAFSARFAREAKALAKLHHPGIVTIHDFGQADGLFFFVMEFVDGVNLRQLLQAGRVSPREALAIVPQICDALQYAHDEGIVHRDIKPENILLDRKGRVKVADFGLAKLVGEASEPGSEGGPTGTSTAVTEAGTIVGTPNYIAPEQIEHPQAVDHRADIYALGVVLYQMLTGELPGKLIVPPSSKVQVDVRLDEVVLRALEQKPEHRYQQASAFKTQVETIAQTAQSAPPLNQKEINEAEWRNPANWSFGLYFSKKDSRKWWVPRRIPGTGWTINLGHWQGAATLLAILASLIVAILFGIRLQEHGPSTPVPGKPIAQWATARPLSEWIGDLQSPQPNTRKLAERAIAELGTNSLPEILRILGNRDSSVEGDDLRYNTAAALKFVGPGLESAIPSFVSLLASGNQQSAYAGARALTFTAGSVPKAFDELTNGLGSPSPGVRDAAAHGISLLPGIGLTQMAEEALPALLQNLKDPANFVRADTAAALEMYVQHQRLNGLDAKGRLIIPAVIPLLEDHYSYARQYAALVLREYEKDAVPILLDLLNNPDPGLREGATNALVLIGYSNGPTAAHRAKPH